MKLLKAAAIASIVAGPVFAGGMEPPKMEMDPIVAKTSSSSGGILIPLLLVVLLAAAVSAN